MGKVAFIFPGQGAQKTGMGLDLYNNCEEAKHVFEIADKVLGKSVSKMCFEGTEEELKQTVNTQSALLTVSIAVLESFKSRYNIEPSYLAGHSLGEYAALYAAGVLDLENVFLAIQKRADLMHKATLSKEKGAMAAILGLQENDVKQFLLEGCSIANYNEPKQLVITGVSDAVLKTSEILKEKGARKVVPLAVSGAFHSALMAEASLEFGEFVQKLQINDAKIPVITNVDAKITTNATDFRTKMPKQISSSVYWTQTIQKMLIEGVDTFIEMGAGRVLTGLNRKICLDDGVKNYNISDMQSLEAFMTF